MTLNEAKAVIYVNVVYACEKAGLAPQTTRLVQDACDTIIALADRKTENSSEKPNNCDTCANGEGDIEACGYCRHGDLYEPKDEPQTDCGDFADRLAYERGVKHAWEVAQKVFDSTVTFYEAEDVAKQIDKDINVRSKDCETCKWGEDKHRYAHICNECGVGINNYEPKDEPQTENPCDGCVCDDGKHLMYCMNCKGIAWKTEPPKVGDEPQTDCAWGKTE